MKFRTEVFPEKIAKPIAYGNKILALGSCFTENIGGKLERLKYDININPFGIQYNPASIADGLNRIIEGKLFELSDLFEHNGEWHSFMHHSDFSDEVAENALLKMNRSLELAANSIRKTDILLITFGTAWIFSFAANASLVNNCHKLAADKFYRSKLSVDEAYNLLKKPLETLTSMNPDLHIIISISPIRHLKDGAQENQLSKATLLLCAEKLSTTFKNLYYFPAYELLMDDLRDYRFYASDMTHPGSQAIDYIWEKFEESCLNAAEHQIRKEIGQLMQSFHHRLFNPNSDRSRKFALSQLGVIDKIKQKFPFNDFEQESDYFNSILNTKS